MKGTRIIQAGLLAAGISLLAGCAHTPGGISASSTPLEGRKYTVLGQTSGSDSQVALLGILPVTGPNTTRSAIEDATRRLGADALIDVTVEGRFEWWILFTRCVTEVEGTAIRFNY
jgi:hypothetical protein